MFYLNWLLFKHVRQASDMKRQVTMLLNEQRDLLAADKIANLQNAIKSMDDVLCTTSEKKTVQAEMNRLEKIANDNLRPYPAAAIRENIKEIMVAITTIMAFTSFFLQLTKIPTGSMQPTLNGITHENLENPAQQIPGQLGRIRDYWVHGWQYNYFIAPEDGRLEVDQGPKSIFPFVKRQTFRFAGKSYSITFAGDALFGTSPETGHSDRAIVRRDLDGRYSEVKKGEYVFAVKIIAGDHLLVDRFTYNFRKPERGEIIVFKTRGIQGLQQDQLYIKRLVGLSGEKIQIGDDQHIIADGRRITAADRHFEMVYSFNNKTDPVAAATNEVQWNYARYITANKPPYRGHVNQKVAQDIFHLGEWPGLFANMAPLFPDENSVLEVRPTHYLPMGDNQLNSSDGRVFGDFDRKNLIGKCWFVYWPITDRFGWGYR
jgi:signal peptidase I